MHKAQYTSEARRPKRPGGPTRWHIVAVILIAVVGLNVGIGLTLIGVYWVSRGAQLPAPGPLAMLQTVMPPLPTATDGGPTPEPTATLPPPTGVVNILLMGIDERPDESGQPSRTDTMMVLRLDFDNRTAKLISFPRDVWLALPNLEQYGITEGRINTAYYYGELYGLPGGGPKEAMDTVTLNFGIPLDHYALVNFDGFKKSVDALGGIDIDVPKRIYDENFPTDDYGYMTLIVEPGPQHMDGAQALRYARTRHQDSDTERIKRQQLVLLAIRDKAISLNAIARLPELYSAVSGSYKTDMDLRTLLTYGFAGQQIDRSQITTFAIDQSYLVGWTTEGGANVWIPQRARIGPVIEEFLARP